MFGITKHCLTQKRFWSEPQLKKPHVVCWTQWGWKFGSIKSHEFFVHSCVLVDPKTSCGLMDPENPQIMWCFLFVVLIGASVTISERLKQLAWQPIVTQKHVGFKWNIRSPWSFWYPWHWFSDFASIGIKFKKP